MKKTVLVLWLGLFPLGCIGFAAGQICQSKAIEIRVDSIFREMIKTAEILDYDKLTSGVDDRHNAGFIVGGTYYEKYDELINLLKSRSSGVAGQHIVVQKEKITVLSDSIVLLTACGESQIDLKNGTVVATKFDWSFVYKKIDNKWKVIQSHQSVSR